MNRIYLWIWRHISGLFFRSPLSLLSLLNRCYESYIPINIWRYISGVSNLLARIWIYSVCMNCMCVAWPVYCGPICSYRCVRESACIYAHTAYCANSRRTASLLRAPVYMYECMRERVYIYIHFTRSANNRYTVHLLKARLCACACACVCACVCIYYAKRE